MDAVQKFCIEQMLMKYYEIFYNYLMAKYDNKLPDNIDLRAEWHIFVNDATSKVE